MFHTIDEELLADGKRQRQRIEKCCLECVTTMPVAGKRLAQGKAAIACLELETVWRLTDSRGGHIASDLQVAGDTFGGLTTFVHGRYDKVGATNHIATGKDPRVRRLIGVGA